METTEKNKSVLYNIFILIVLSVALKGIGFINRIVIAYYYGTSNATDIFYNVSGFIESISAIILSGLTVGIINIYISNKVKKINNNIFISNIIFLILISMGFLTVICGASAGGITKLLAPSYTALMHSDMEIMLKILAIAFPFQGMVTVWGAVLQAENIFTPVKLTGTFSSIASIVCIILLANKLKINALVIAFLIGYILNAVFLWSNTKKIIKPKIRLKYLSKDESIKKLVVLVIPLLIGTAGHELNLIIDKSVASQLIEGAVSALSYSCVLYLFIENVIINSIVTAIFPDMTKALNKGEEDDLAVSTGNILLLAEVLLVPLVICTYFNSVNITDMIYMRGNFDEKSLILTSAALMGYVIGLPFLALRDIITRVYYAYSDTKTPVIINLISVVINIALDFLFGYLWGVMGITLSTSVSNIFSGVAMVLYIKKYNSAIMNRRLVKEITIILGGAIISAGCSYWVVLNFSKIIALMISLLGAFIIEVLLMYIFKSLFLKEIIKKVKKGFRK